MPLSLVKWNYGFEFQQTTYPLYYNETLGDRQSRSYLGPPPNKISLASSRLKIPMARQNMLVIHEVNFVSKNQSCETIEY